MSGAGWVYILTNPAMPGLIKIGLTTRNPSARAAELGGSTGVPAAFAVAWCRAVSDCEAVEATVHRMMGDKRVSGRREFFRCDVATARQVIEAAAGAQLGRSLTPRPRHAPARRRGKRRRDADRIAALLVMAACVVVLVSIFQPGWLSLAVAQAVQAVR